MKKIIPIIVLFFLQLSPDQTIEQYINNENKFNYTNIQNKNLEKNIKNYVEYTDSFAVAYMNDNNVQYYCHNNTLDTIYDIASITKTFTSIAIIKLQSDGLLHVDDKAAQFVAYYDTNVTIRHLITHSAFKPYGTKYSYSNLGYVVLKDIIESVTKKEYHEVIIEKIFEPLDMKHTFAHFSSGAGGILSTTNDLLKFCYMLSHSGIYNGKTILNEKEYNLLFESTRENREPEHYYWSTGGFETFVENGTVTSFYKSGLWYESASGIEITKDGRALVFIGKPWCTGINGTVLRWRNRLWRFLRVYI